MEKIYVYSMIISLGNSCKVREAIQRYMKVDSLESTFFDWVLSNFLSVLYFISTDTPLKESDFIKTEKQIGTHRIVHHTSARFETLHDVLFDADYEKEVTELAYKYNRRLTRFKNTISSNETIHFIHLADCEKNDRMPDKNIYVPTLEDIALFDTSIKKINPSCSYYLHIVLPPDNCIFYKKVFDYDKKECDKLISKNVFVHYLTQDVTKEPCREQCRHWSWNDVFDTIPS